jgi:hypothetical protein
MRGLSVVLAVAASAMVLSAAHAQDDQAVRRAPALMPADPSASAAGLSRNEGLRSSEGADVSNPVEPDGSRSLKSDVAVPGNSPPGRDPSAPAPTLQATGGTGGGSGQTAFGVIERRDEKGRSAPTSANRQSWSSGNSVNDQCETLDVAARRDGSQSERRGKRSPFLEDEELHGITTRRNCERTTFSDAEIADGFFKVAFGAELAIAGSDDRIRKFDGPVRVFLDNRSQADRRADMEAVIGDIRASVDHLDIALTQDRKAANVVVTLVRDHRALLRTMRSFYGHKLAGAIERRLQPRCLSGFSQDPQHRIRRAEVLLTADGGDFSFLDCAYEELLQALGPINDDRSVPWTMFNDEVQMGFFDVYDQYILNILYDPRVHPGMTRRDVETLLPDILSTVRRSIWQKSAGGFGAGAEQQPANSKK